MKKLSDITKRIIDVSSGQFCAWLTLGLMFLVLAEVFTRYILNSPLMLADEIGGYVCVAIAFIALAFTWQEGGHVRIEVVVSRFPEKLRKWIRLIGLIIVTSFCPVLIWASYELFAYSHSRGVRSDTWLRTIMEWPQVVLLIGSVLLVLPVVSELVKTIGELRASKEKYDGS